MRNKFRIVLTIEGMIPEKNPNKKDQKMKHLKVTKRPKTKPYVTEDGTQTNMGVTLHDSVCLDKSGPRKLPAGTILTVVTSHGNGHIGKCVRCSVAGEGLDVEFLA